MTTENSRADALTDIDIVDMLEAAGVAWQWVGIPTAKRMTSGSIDADKIIAGVRAILAASHVEQPAAPINEPLWDRKGNVIHEAVDRLGTARAPSPEDERAAFERAFNSLLNTPMILERSASGYVDVAADRMWKGYQWGLQACRAASANETGATVGWAWISPTGHISRFTVDFDGKHDQLAMGWKVRPVAFCDSADNETGAEGAKPIAASEGIETALTYLGACGGFDREVEAIRTALSRSPAMAGRTEKDADQ